MEVKERIAYVRGLVEGAESFAADSTERTVWENLLLICDQLAESVAQVESGQLELEEYVETIDADLCDLEDEVYGEHRGRRERSAIRTGEPEEDDFDGEIDEEMVRVECPHCGEEVYFEEEFLYDDAVEIACPECGKVLFRGSDNGHLVFGDEGENVTTQQDHQD